MRRASQGWGGCLSSAAYCSNCPENPQDMENLWKVPLIQRPWQDQVAGEPLMPGGVVHHKLQTEWTRKRRLAGARPPSSPARGASVARVDVQAIFGVFGQGW